MNSVDIRHGDCLEVLRELPDNSVDSVVTDLAAGTAAEHLVCADLLMQGHGAYLTDQNTAYDVVADVGGSLIRVQVKATREQRAIPQRVTHVPAYMWHVRRRGRGGARVYGDGEYDLLALVALDCKRIAYMPPEMKLQTVHIRPEGTSGGKQFDDYPFSKAIEGIVR